MYRVELKVPYTRFIILTRQPVPNVPCGVERYLIEALNPRRVALFLMYRVELKVCKVSQSLEEFSLVPNVPCGVESGLGKLNKIRELFVPNVPCGVERSLKFLR